MTEHNPLRGPAPLLPSDRIEALDVMRGVALLGIFIMNMPSFGSSFFMPEAAVREKMDSASALDSTVFTLNAALLEGKFNGLFTLLFGMGLALQMSRLSAEGGPFVAVRRMVVLLGFGVLHTTLLWNGDVLHIYAVLGLLLILLKGRSAGLLLALANLLLLGQFAHGVLMAQHWSLEAYEAEQQFLAGLHALDNAVYGSGAWWDGVFLRTRESLLFYTHPFLWPPTAWFWLALLTTAVWGLWVQRSGWLKAESVGARWLASPAGLKGLLALWAVALGLWFLSRELGGEHDLKEAPTPGVILGWMLSDTHRVLMVLSYAGFILRWCMTGSAGVVRRALSRVGRMPLTMYLLQSVMGTFIFHGWGLGYWDQTEPAAQTALAMALFAGVQVPLARWWLARHQWGPAEALWRRLSYGRPPNKP